LVWLIVVTSWKIHEKGGPSLSGNWVPQTSTSGIIDFMINWLRVQSV